MRTYFLQLSSFLISSTHMSTAWMSSSFHIMTLWFPHTPIIYSHGAYDGCHRPISARLSPRVDRRQARPESASQSLLSFSVVQPLWFLRYRSCTWRLRMKTRCL